MYINILFLIIKKFENSLPLIFPKRILIRIELILNRSLSKLLSQINEMANIHIMMSVKKNVHIP